MNVFLSIDCFAKLNKQGWCGNSFTELFSGHGKLSNMILLKTAAASGSGACDTQLSVCNSQAKFRVRLWLLV